MGTTEDVLGQEPRVWLWQGSLASQGTRLGALAAVVVERAHGNGNGSDKSHGKPVPGNGAGWGRCGDCRAAQAAEIKGVDFTGGAPGRSGYPPGRTAGEPGLVIVSLIRSLKAPQRAGVGGGGGHLLCRHKLLLWRRRVCFFTQSRCFQHASSSVGNLVQ